MRPGCTPIAFASLLITPFLAIFHPGDSRAETPRSSQRAGSARARAAAAANAKKKPLTLASTPPTAPVQLPGRTAGASVIDRSAAPSSGPDAASTADPAAGGSQATGETPFTRLAPIVVDGTPADALALDPIVPEQRGQAGLTGGSGSLERSLGRGLALPITDYGWPGTAAAVRGLGRSVEDTGVQALGVPLNYAGGGGFDLSVFPQYLWSDYRFQAGPTLGAFDPRAVSGSLDLVPWTARALSDPAAPRMRVTQFYSDFPQSQTAVAAKSGEDVAVAAGYSQGEVIGPSGSVSAKWDAGASALGRVSGKVHLLATRMDAVSRGSRSFPTPEARQLTARVIPVLQADVQGRDALLKTSFFYDATYLRYENPEDAAFGQGRTHVYQLGTENAYLNGPWRLGLSARGAGYQPMGSELLREDLVSASVTRTLQAGVLTVEPTAQVVSVTDFGAQPAGSLGARVELPAADGGAGTHALFARLGSSSRFPTLSDRYDFMSNVFIGNSSLSPERDTTLTAGYEWKGGDVTATFEGYQQWRNNVILPQMAGTARTLTNADEARVSALMHGMKIAVAPVWDLSHSLTLTDSYVQSTGLAFPYLPSKVYKLSSELHERGDRPGWLAAIDLRTQGSASAGSAGVRVPGYGVADLRGSAHLFKLGSGPLAPSFDLTGQVENLFDRAYETVRDYPMPGRVYSMALIGQF